MRVFRFLSTVLLGLLLGVSPLVAQAGGLSVCHGVNHRNDFTDGDLLMPAFPGWNSNEIAIRFTMPRALTIEGAELFFGTALSNGGPLNQVPWGTLQIRGHDPVLGIPTGLISGSGPAATQPLAVQGQVMGWRGTVFNVPVTLMPGDVAWLSFYDGAGNATNVGTQLHGSVDDTPYVTSFGSSLPTPPIPSWSPVMNDRRFKIRLLGQSCPTDQAGSELFGLNWPAGVGPWLQTVSPPIAGAGFLMIVSNAPPQTPVSLLWAPTADPIGTPFLGGPTLHLDAASTLSLFAAGANPYQDLTTNILGNGYIGFLIPDLPSLLGASLAFQALVFDPAGAPVATGVGVTTTHALEITIGY